MLRGLRIGRSQEHHIAPALPHSLPRHALLAEVHTQTSPQARPSTGFQRLWRCYMSRTREERVPGFHENVEM